MRRRSYLSPEQSIINAKNTVAVYVLLQVQVKKHFILEPRIRIHHGLVFNSRKKRYNDMPTPFRGYHLTFIMSSKVVLHLDVFCTRATMDRSRSANSSCIVCTILLGLFLSNDNSKT